MNEEERTEEERPWAAPDEDPYRRQFLARLTLGLGALAGLIIALPPAMVALWPLRRSDSRGWRAVGRVEDFPIGTTRKVIFEEPRAVPWAGEASSSAAWLRREGESEFVAFSIYCTHTACPVTWQRGSQLFLCPCHGGAFHRDGSVAAGPPQTPLERHPVRVREGVVEIGAIGAPRQRG